MPIQVATRKLHIKKNNLSDALTGEMINAAVDGFAEEVRKGAGNLICEEHPNQISHITIVADRHDTMKIEKKFCCDEFSKRVDVTIKK